MSEYRVTVKDVAVRQHEISEKAEASSDERPFYQLYSGNQRLPIVQVDIGLPVYRMENYRTQTAQRAHIRRHDLRHDFFVLGTEDVDAQQAQHDILVELANEGRGDTIIPITTALERDARQTDPLLLTREGVVVNGNRRLAAMRELYARRPDQFESFHSVEAMILPAGIDQNEIRRIEVRLQMQPQTQLPYDWMNTALAVRDMRHRNMPDSEIKMLMRLDKESEIAEMIEQLEEAEFYLDDYLGKPGQYEEIEGGHEQLFRDLQAAVRAKRTAGEKESARCIGHVLASNSRALGKRVYDYNPAFGKRMTVVMERLATRYDVDVTENGDGKDDDLFGGAEPPDPYLPVRKLLKDGSRSEAFARDIQEIYDEIREEDREQDAANKALKNAQKANTALSEISLAQADPGTFDAIRAQLESVRTRAGALLKDLAERLAAR